MKGVGATYGAEIHGALGRCGTWLPHNAIAVGDIVSIEEGGFGRLTTLNELGVQVEIQPAGGSDVLTYSTRGGVDIRVAGEGAAATQSGSMAVAFSRAFAVLLALGPSTVHSAGRYSALSLRIGQLYSQGVWDPDWILVTEVLEASTGLVAVGGERGGTLAVGLNGGASLATALALGGKLEVQASSGTSYCSAFSSGFTPLFRAALLTRRGQLKYRSHPGAPVPTNSSDEFALVEWAPGSVEDGVRAPD